MLYLKKENLFYFKFFELGGGNMSRLVLKGKETAVFEFLQKQNDLGSTPSIREICSAVGIKSTSGVHAILSSLEKKGYIERSKSASRSIKILNRGPIKSVPILGEIAAGNPILAVENIEGYIPFPHTESDGLFALKVTGHSMRDIGILDGDIIIADRNLSAQNGDIIVGLDGDSATVKTLDVIDGKVAFIPHNPDFSPIYPENPIILGKVIGNFRKY
jgi:repressor LexA